LTHTGFRGFGKKAERMTDTRLTKWAETLVRYSLYLKPKEQVLIRADEAAIPLAKEVYRSALAAGAYPRLQVLVNGATEEVVGDRFLRLLNTGFLSLLSLLFFCVPAFAAPTALINATVEGAKITYIAVRLHDPHIKVQVEVCHDFPGGDEPFPSMVHRLAPLAAINGSYFSKQTKLPIGDIVRDGQVLLRGDFGTAFCLTADGEPSIKRVVLSHAMDWEGQKLVLACGPALVLDGRVDVDVQGEGFHDSHIIGSAARMAVGYTRDGHLLLVRVLTPVIFAREAVILQTLGCVGAINLDAGASTAMFYHGKYVATPGRRLTNLLCVYER
jgi:hypothetical protein